MSSPQAPGTVPVAPGLPAWDNYSYRAVPAAPLPKPGSSRERSGLAKARLVNDHNSR
jgi:hypothetical protein